MMRIMVALLNFLADFIYTHVVAVIVIDFKSNKSVLIHEIANFSCKSSYENCHFFDVHNSHLCMNSTDLPHQT